MKRRRSGRGAGAGAGVGVGVGVGDAWVQYYDGASAMKGAKTGVPTQIKSINPKCLFTHCYGHALHLAVGDVFKTCHKLREALVTAYEIGKLIKRSQKRNTKIDELRSKTKNNSKSTDALCPTRWTVRGKVWHPY